MNKKIKKMEKNLKHIKARRDVLINRYNTDHPQDLINLGSKEAATTSEKQNE